MVSNVSNVEKYALKYVKEKFNLKAYFGTLLKFEGIFLDIVKVWG